MNNEKYKFSQGEWDINPRAKRNVRCEDKSIANCSGSQSGDNSEEEVYNALLISKSPKMLEMLKEIVNQIEDGKTYVTKDDIKQLIKEATQLQEPQTGGSVTEEYFNN